MYKILSIDGGGIRGVIPAVVLEYLEHVTGKSVSSCFDLVVGTSTGGIIAAGLTVPDSSGKPKYSASDMLEIYTKHGGEIFERSFWRGITSLGGLADEQYSEERLEELLLDYFKDTTLKDCLKPIVLTTYDIERRKPYFFKTRRAKEQSDRNHYLRDATRATSAAPTYFEPENVSTVPETHIKRALIDGGVFANNPAMVAYSEAIASGANHNDILLVSIGTGVTNRPIPFDDAKDWGLAGWLRPLVGVMMDGTADNTNFHLSHLLPDVEKPTEQRFFRFDTELDKALDDLDAAHTGNIEALKREAADIIQSQAEEFTRLKSLLE